MNLTKNELEIMDVMWRVGKPLSRGQLMEESVDKSWKSSSVHILLNSMLKKGAILEAGFARCGKTCGRTYAPNITVEEYYVSTLSATKTRPDPVKLFAAAGEALGLDIKEVEESLEILRAVKADLQ